jgi:hypothetical protein
MELNRGQREQGGKDDGLTILPDPRERSTTGMKRYLCLAGPTVSHRGGHSQNVKDAKITHDLLVARQHRARKKRCATMACPYINSNTLTR